MVNRRKTLTEEHKKRISKALTGTTRSQETKDKISKALTGKKHTDEARKKMSKAHRGQGSVSIIGTNVYDGTEIRFEKITDAIAHGFYQGAISSCLSGRRKTHKDYTWRRVKND